MTGAEYHFDPVEDGRPTRDRLLYAGGVLFVAFGLFDLHNGRYGEAFDSFLFAVWFVLADKSYRIGWKRGYTAALASLKDKIE